jgi:hypothetical protein
MVAAVYMLLWNSTYFVSVVASVLLSVIAGYCVPERNGMQASLC